MDYKQIIVLEEEDEERLDVYLTDQLVSFSRSKIQQLIRSGHILVNQTPRKPHYLVQAEDDITIEIPEPLSTKAVPQNIPLDMIYEDDQLIVVNKPQGMVVHPAPGNYSETLVNALLFHCAGRLSSINGIIRPGIVHRIDKDTSGILVVAKTDEAHVALAKQFQDHSIHRTYEFLAFGSPKEDFFTVDKPLARNPKDRKKIAVVTQGKNAITHFRVLERFRGYSYMEASLETGRTHQIRVHASFSGFPLIGDPLYTSRQSPFPMRGQALHAKILGFMHPLRLEYMEFSCPPPEVFCKTLAMLRQQYHE